MGGSKNKDIFSQFWSLEISDQDLAELLSSETIISQFFNREPDQVLCDLSIFLKLTPQYHHFDFSTNTNLLRNRKVAPDGSRICAGTIS